MSGASALALSPSTVARAAGSARTPETAPPDPYDSLRARWLEITLGTGYDPSAEPYASRIAETARLAGAHLAAMAPAPGSLWPDCPWTRPAGITRSYGFPLGTRDLRALREDRTGAWSDINTAGATDRAARRYQTLWLDHGTDPVDRTYDYLLMPGADRATVASRAIGRGGPEILANTAARQAVAVPRLGLVAANFWQPGTVGPLTATRPAAVLVRERSSTAVIHLSDPARSGEAVEITWRHPVRAVAGHDPDLEVLDTGRALRLRLSGGTAGSSHRCDVTLR
ncbi:polysaccharide lyase beta-sandwich domain-containing protein [Streptomyces sp. NPDC004609]|uniref:polysaccharide lyase beta-sandwich domain-containing protein n=1 Tax=Streptomyces sp. NPDC004609 TaxID=3364704 RepID=UPI0036C06EF1